MSIPDYQSLMLPLLKHCAKVEETRLSDAVEALAAQFKLTNEELNELLPSGVQTVFHNRVGWARTYLVKAALLDAPRRGVFRITDRGRKVLSSNPSTVNVKSLEKFPEFMEFREKKSSKSDEIAETPSNKSSVPADSLETPDDTMIRGYKAMREALVSQLREEVSKVTSAYFERLVVDLLVRMGYGGSRESAARVVGGTGDGGIDGVIDEDKLGLDVIYIQAKRWVNTVGEPQLREFAGALQSHRAKKGVFVTTSEFSAQAREFVKKVDSRIILIDGRRLAELMIDHGVGVTKQETYVVNKIDTDYFGE